MDRFVVVEVSGCFPHVNIAIDEEGKTIVFNTKKEAKEWAKENCAWGYRIVEF